MPWLLAALLLLGTVPLFFHRLEASRAAQQVNNCVLGADVASIGRALDAGNTRGLKARKHPLGVVALAVVARPLHWAGVPHRQATSAGLALIQGLGVAALFLFLARHLAPVGAALAATLFFLSLFGPATLFGVTDSYGLTFAAMAVALLLLGELSRVVNWRQAGLGAGLVVAAAGLANPPAMAILPVHAALRRRAHGGGVGAIGRDLVLAGAVALLVALLLPLIATNGWGLDYAQRWMSLEGLADRRLLADYMAGFWLFALVGPLEVVQCRFGASLLAEMGVPRLAALLLSAGVLLLGGGFALCQRPARGVALALLAGVAGLFLFYLLFNPGEVLLYSPQWLLLLVAAAAPGLGGWRAPLVAAVAALNMAVNLPPLMAPASADPMRCCPDPPPSMEARERPEVQARRLCGATP